MVVIQSRHWGMSRFIRAQKPFHCLSINLPAVSSQQHLNGLPQPLCTQREQASCWPSHQRDIMRVWAGEWLLLSAWIMRRSANVVCLNHFKSTTILSPLPFPVADKHLQHLQTCCVHPSFLVFPAERLWWSMIHTLHPATMELTPSPMGIALKSKATVRSSLFLQLFAFRTFLKKKSETLLQQVWTVFRNSESPLKAFLQRMWTKMCCECVIFPCNRLRCHYLHTHQTPGPGLNYQTSTPPPLLSQRLGLRCSGFAQLSSVSFLFFLFFFLVPAIRRLLTQQLDEPIRLFCTILEKLPWNWLEKRCVFFCISVVS